MIFLCIYGWNDQLMLNFMSRNSVLLGIKVEFSLFFNTSREENLIYPTTGVSDGRGIRQA